VGVTVRQLAEMVQGEVCGDGNLIIERARPLDEASTGDITFIQDTRQALKLARCKASAFVAPPDVNTGNVPAIKVADPLAAFIIIVRHMQGHAEHAPSGIDTRAVLHATVKVGDAPSIHEFVSIGEGTTIGARCRIHAGVVIGAHCQIGDDVTLFPRVVLYDGTVLGQRCIIHAGAVIGADGFGYRFHEGRHVKVPQLGHVEIGDDVEIGANSTVDRGTFGATRIGAGTKIDNLVQVAHNCQIGRHNLLVAQVGIGGSSSTGDYVILAGQVGVVEHIHIGERTIVGAKAGVIKSIDPGSRLWGIPAIPEREQKLAMKALQRLPELRREVRAIKEHLGLKDDDEMKKAG
jgi:UDP-3-O-[3-hydroxymyristoyl] glucosamine N-acyltransferase